MSQLKWLLKLGVINGDISKEDANNILEKEKEFDKKISTIEGLESELKKYEC